MKRLVLIHTVAPLIEVFNKLGREILPEVKLTHVLDEPLLEQARSHGTIAFGEPDGMTRLKEHISAAEDVGANVVLVTCSTISPYLDEVNAEIPVVKIDQAMIEQAVDAAGRVLVLATNLATLEPTRRAVVTWAAWVGKPIDVQVRLVEQAFDAVLSGDTGTHDRLVQAAIRDAPAEVDLIVLAQASMARVLDTLPEANGSQTNGSQIRRHIPILTSPHTALRRVKEILEGLQA